MSKQNTPFNKGNSVAQADPVAQAHAAALAAESQKITKDQEKVAVVDAESIQPESASETPVKDAAPLDGEVVSEPLPVEQLAVSVTNAKDPEAQAPKGATDVKDTSKVDPTPVDKPTIVAKPQVVNPNVVKRGDGASPRQASPQGAADVQKTVVSNSFSAMIAAEKAKGQSWSSDLISFLERYVEAMAPRRITSSADIAKWQEGLYDKLVAVIERSPSNEFNRLWRIAIAYFGEYKSGCFSPVYYSRGAKEWKRDPKQYQMLAALANLLEASARDIKSVNQVVNVNAVVGKSFSEEGRGRVIAFYLK